MSTKVIDAEHFVPLASLPEFGPTTTVADAYKQLGTTGNGAFVYSENGTEFVVEATKLIRDLFHDQPNWELRDRSRWSLSKALGSASRASILQVNDRHLSPTDDPTDLIDDAGPAQAFLVVDGERRLGWLLTSKSVVQPATKRYVYICSNHHENPDPDHGTCYVCPAKIVKSEMR
jgi:hypothetical protein